MAGNPTGATSEAIVQLRNAESEDRGLHEVDSSQPGKTYNYAVENLEIKTLMKSHCPRAHCTWRRIKKLS